FYLRQVANIAYDPSFLVLGHGGFEKQGPVPDATPAEMALAGITEFQSRVTLPGAVWKKIAYVMARGGRFEDYVVGYLPSRAVAIRLEFLTVGQIAESSLGGWAKPPGALGADDLGKPMGGWSPKSGRTHPDQPGRPTPTDR
ncbi:hypothetical protein B1B_04453, partial [mine drainage metagenome]